jgi:hypothetical protein
MSNNAYTDSRAKFWTDDRDHSTEVGPGYAEDVNDDVAAAFKESSEKGEIDDEIEESRDSLETLRRVHGSVKDGIEWNVKLADYYRIDPEAAKEFHKRTYYTRMPDVAPAPEAKAEPPADLTESGREEWDRYHAVKNAYHTSAKEAAFRKEIADAAPLFAKVRKNYGPLTKALQDSAAIHEAMSINPEAANRLAFASGAPATQGHAQEIAQQKQADRYAEQWLGQVVASGSMPGLQDKTIRMAVGRAMQGLVARGQSSGDPAQDLAKAYGAAMTVHNEVQDEKRARELIAKIDKPAAKKPRKSESAGEDDKDEIREAARAAYRSHTRAA